MYISNKWNLSIPIIADISLLSLKFNYNNILSICFHCVEIS